MLNSRRLYLVNKITGLLPPTGFYALKRYLYRWAGVTIGDNTRLVSSVNIIGTGELTIGHDVFIGHETTIICSGSKVIIDDCVDISSFVKIINGTHEIELDKSKRAAGSGYTENIVINAGAWIGAGCIIIGGVSVGQRTILGAGSCLYKSTEPDAVYGSHSMRLLSKND